jgi:hypothetical protein
MVGLQTLDLAIGVRVPASQPNRFKQLRAAEKLSRPFCVPNSVPTEKFGLIQCRFSGDPNFFMFLDRWYREYKRYRLLREVRQPLTSRGVDHETC